MRKTRRQLLASATALVAGPALAQIARPPAPHRGALLLSGALLHPVSRAPLQRGQLLVVDGRIAAVAAEGEAMSLPAGTQRIALDGLRLYPGLVAANTQLGLVEVPTVRASLDAQELGLLNPGALAISAFHADSELLAISRAEGVLAAEVAPLAGPGGLIAGRSGVVQLDGWTWPDMALRAEHALHIQLPPSRPVSAWMSGAQQAGPPPALVRQRLQELEEMLLQARAQGANSASSADLRLAALAPYALGRSPVFVHAAERAQIRQALQLADRLGLQMVLVAGPDAAEFAPLLKARDIAVIVDGVQRLPLRRDDAIDVALGLPARLHEAGVRFAIAHPRGVSEVANLRNLALEAGAAVAHGLPAEAALRAITLSAAELLGVADQLGSLTPGKLASFFVSDGDPLQPGNRVQRVFVRGRELDIGHRHQRLMQKYAAPR